MGTVGNVKCVYTVGDVKCVYLCIRLGICFPKENNTYFLDNLLYLYFAPLLLMQQMAIFFPMEIKPL